MAEKETGADAVDYSKSGSWTVEGMHRKSLLAMLGMSLLRTPGIGSAAVMIDKNLSSNELVAQKQAEANALLRMLNKGGAATG